MKFKNINLLVLGIFLSLVFNLQAQESKQDLVIPLSKPGSPGSLEVGLISGSISVEGYSGKEVIIKALYNDNDEDRYKKRNQNDNIDGLKKISMNSFNLDVEEKDNRVEVSSDNYNKTIDLDIKVPQNFSLDLGTINHGSIKVTGVKGDHEISNVNGDIEMFSISGSAVVSNVNGKIEITFSEVTPNKAMSFATLNKKIDVTFPANTKTTLKMDSKMGEIYTDFDVDLVKTEPEVKKSTGDNTYKLEISKYQTAKINGGGPEFNFKNFNGNIIIRKGK
jgi:hypothetical protein